MCGKLTLKDCIIVTRLFEKMDSQSSGCASNRE